MSSLLEALGDLSDQQCAFVLLAAFVIVSCGLAIGHDLLAERRARR